MNKGLITGLLVTAILLGVGAAAFVVARSPSFWIQLFYVGFTAALPFILKRKSPEEEAKDHEKLARGQQVGNEKPWGHQKGVDS